MTLLDNLERLSRGHFSGCFGYNALGPQRKAMRQDVGEGAGQGNEEEEKIEREGKRVARTRGGDGKEGKKDVGKKRERRTEKQGWWRDWRLSPLWSYHISVAGCFPLVYG